MPAQGSIHLLGQPISKLNSKEKAQQLAWLGQSVSSVAEGMTVYDTAMLGRLPHQGWLDLPSHADHAAVVQALHETQCWDWRERQLSSLSGGERQRVLLARVLAVQARVVLMDEPLVNLDPPHQADWVNTVRALTVQGTTVVSVLHEVNVALLADHLLVIADGQVVHAGRCKEQDAHIALETVFKHRIKVVQLQSQFQALLNVTF
jgi:iron complex transport system ATP-binding protein